MNLNATLDTWENQTNAAMAATLGAVPPGYVWAMAVCLSLIVGAGLTWLLYINITRATQMGMVAKALPPLRALIQSQAEEIQSLKQAVKAQVSAPPQSTWAEEQEKLSAFVHDQLTTMRKELSAMAEKGSAEARTIAKAVQHLRTSNVELSAKIDRADTSHLLNTETALTNGHDKQWSGYLRDQLALMRAEMDLDTETDDRLS